MGDVTITINSRGEINVDQSAIAEVLGSGQQTARVTFVKVDDEGLSTIENQVDLDASELLAAVGQADSAAAGHVTDAIDTGVNVGLILDPEQLNKLEKVLESDEARNLLGDPSQSLKVHDKPVVTPPVAPSPMRRSQRQVDRSFMHKMLFFRPVIGQLSPAKWKYIFLCILSHFKSFKFITF